MDALSLVVGALLLGAGFFAGSLVYGGEQEDQCRSAYKKEYAKQNGLYQPRRR